jgi:hypothetical protein
MRIEPHPRDDLPGIVIAIVAGLHKAILTSTPVNDDYQHLAYARQILGGDLPFRDFWDLSTTLQYGLSAAFQLLFGHRLLAEAVLIGLATAVAVYLVFRVVQQATGSALIATVCAALFIVAIPRAYAYPKWIVYAVAAWLWWRYVWWPSSQIAVAAGLSAAAAFYWRHDHGAFVAIGVVLGMVAAHGFTLTALRRTGIAGGVALAAVLPYLLFAFIQVGPTNIARAELIAFGGEHAATHAKLRWPLRATADLLRLEPQDAYAPEMTIRWRVDASTEARAASLTKYALTPIAAAGPQTQRVRLSARSFNSLRSLIADPLVEDTAGVERGPASFSWTQWPVWERVRFRVPFLRFTLLPAIDRPIAAGAAAAILLYAIPLVAALLAGPSLRRRLPPAVSPRVLLLFAVFAVVVNLGLVRQPYESRAADAIVLPAILFGIFLFVLLRPGSSSLLRSSLRIAAVGVLLLAVKSLAVAGDFGDRAAWLVGDGQSMARARGAWHEVAARLGASPPAEFWTGQSGPVSMRLAKYIRRCTASSDRLLVLWFAPEIHYNADRLMAGRQLYFFEGFREVEDEQHRELEKVMRSAPRIVLANRSNYAAAVNAFPALMRYIEATYTTAAAFAEDGEGYRILIRRDSPSPRADQETGWPCYT